jgi:hypothetical protein
VFPTRFEHGHGDQLVAREGVFHHLAVALFEDVQRLHDVRVQHEVRQREQAGDA